MSFSLSGIVPPMVTPINKSEKLDFDKIEKMVDHLITGGVDGIFLLGSTGEFAALNREVKLQLLKYVKKISNGKVPLLAGVTEPGTELTLEMIKAVSDIGIDAVVVAPPYYFPLDQESVLYHYRYLANASKIPIVLYNIPSTTGVFIKLETIVTLAKENTIDCVKDSSGDFIYFCKLINLLKKYSKCSVLQGHEALAAASLIMKADGLVPAYANVFPELYVNLRKIVLNGDIDKAICIQNIINELIATYNFGSVYGSIKTALKEMGLVEDYVTKPLKKPTQKQKDKIKKLVLKIKTNTF